MQLPKLDIKSFDGNSVEWRRFWDNFSSANESLSNIQKMKCLKKVIEKEKLQIELQD